MPNINKILAHPANVGCSKYGADMGRRNQVQGEPERLHLQRVQFVDGDYDTGGAYWGGGRGTAPLYCAFSPDNTRNDPPIRIFVRAETREEAMLAVDALLVEEGFSFYSHETAE